MDPGGGFEPPFWEPKSHVLPLDDPGAKEKITGKFSFAKTLDKDPGKVFGITKGLIDKGLHGFCREI